MRYVGEPVAVVVAKNRYLAEDAVEKIVVDYEPLAANVDPARAQEDDTPLVHDELGSNLVSLRQHVYGAPDTAFDQAAHIVEFDYRYPRYIATPMETFGVCAHYERAPDRFSVWSNFQGPFVIQPLMAAALGVAGQPLAADYTAIERRKLRHQASGRPLHCLDGSCPLG